MTILHHEQFNNSNIIVTNQAKSTAGLWLLSCMTYTKGHKLDSSSFVVLPLLLSFLGNRSLIIYMKRELQTWEKKLRNDYCDI